MFVGHYVDPDTPRVFFTKTCRLTPFVYVAGQEIETCPLSNVYPRKGLNL